MCFLQQKKDETYEQYINLSLIDKLILKKGTQDWAVDSVIGYLQDFKLVSQQVKHIQETLAIKEEPVHSPAIGVVTKRRF